MTTEAHPINWAPDPTSDKPFGQQIIGSVEHHKHKVDLSNYAKIGDGGSMGHSEKPRPRNLEPLNNTRM